uniref:Pre-mRNA-processing factor 17 n=1 Tax=Auxenochlorella protothecoides TaxID=3075 RepID=A0A1D2A1Q3_AUXPR
MDLIGAYSDDGAPSPSRSGDGTAALAVVSAAPEVDASGYALVENKLVSQEDTKFFQGANTRMIRYNLPADQMHAPVQGPTHPSGRKADGGLSNHRTGHVEDSHLSSYAFDEQYNSFHSDGVAMDPSRPVAISLGPGVGAPPTQPQQKRQRTQQIKVAPAPVDLTQPFTLRTRQPWAEKAAFPEQELTEEHRAYLEKAQEEKAEKDAGSGKGETSIFHGKALEDYQGRSWLEAPRDLRDDSATSFLPKKHLHTWSGHTKGVNAIRFFPSTGHLLLSAGLDGKVKMWDVHNQRKCLRTYLGHTKGVRDAWFSNDGRKFVTTGYDKVIRLWDSETGAVLGKYGEGKMAYTVRFHPDDDKQNMLMAGMADKKILQMDTDTGDVVQSYDYHLGAVNTVTFIDEGRRFVSTSDDKTIRVWEFGIPVQIKYIADPAMHAISAVSVTPNKKWWCGQSMDNKIVTYSATDRVKPNTKKTFAGHNVAGYACEVSFSPDSRYVTSGDGEGKLFMWDWKTKKIARTIKAHEGVCIGSAWHPLETSRVATCGWDGLIKYWD